jgi:hypothetical protein
MCRNFNCVYGVNTPYQKASQRLILPFAVSKRKRTNTWLFNYFMANKNWRKTLRLMRLPDSFFANVGLVKTSNSFSM